MQTNNESSSEGTFRLRSRRQRHQQRSVAGMKIDICSLQRKVRLSPVDQMMAVIPAIYTQRCGSLSKQTHLLTADGTNFASNCDCVAELVNRVKYNRKVPEIYFNLHAADCYESFRNCPTTATPVQFKYAHDDSSASFSDLLELADGTHQA